MPIHERDPWRLQYFLDLRVPDDVFIPTDDVDAYAWNPRHRGIYNKLWVAESQGLACGPHGVEPHEFPVFSKPIYNLRGMGVGSRVLHDLAEYEAFQSPGHLWMTLLHGEHVSTDVAVVDGNAAWMRHAVGLARGGGTFDYWTVEAGRRPELEEYCGTWIRENLIGYSGFVNVETIGGRIIEAHLRFSDQWPDLYGEGWLDAMVALYSHGRWNFVERERRTGYSVALFGHHGVPYGQLPDTIAASIRDAPGVSSLQITFEHTRPPISHTMPPGGFRLAIINAWDLSAGLRWRRELAQVFDVVPPDVVWDLQAPFRFGFPPLVDNQG